MKMSDFQKVSLVSTILASLAIFTWVIVDIPTAVTIGCLWLYISARDYFKGDK